MISKKYLKSLIIRILISIVLFLALSIFTRYSNKNLLLFKNHVYDQSFNFSKVSQIYQKLFGQALPAKTATLASSNKISYTKSSSYHDGALLECFRRTRNLLKCRAARLHIRQIAVNIALC